MAIHNEMNYREYNRVRNPSRQTLGDVVATADTEMMDAGYSPYGSLIDNSGAEQMVKVDELSTEAVVPPPLPLGSGAIYDDLLGLSGQLTEQEVYEVYMNAKNGVPPGDIALAYNITPKQVGSIYTAMLNGGTPAEVLNPDSAIFRTMSTASSDSLSSTPINFDAMGNPFQIQTMMAPGGAEVQRALTADAGSLLGGIPIWAVGLGVLALIMMFRK